MSYSGGSIQQLRLSTVSLIDAAKACSKGVPRIAAKWYVRRDPINKHFTHALCFSFTLTTITSSHLLSLKHTPGRSRLSAYAKHVVAAAHV